MKQKLQKFLREPGYYTFRRFIKFIGIIVGIYLFFMFALFFAFRNATPPERETENNGLSENGGEPDGHENGYSVFVPAISLREVGGVYYLFLPYWAREARIYGDSSPEFVTLRGSRLPTVFIYTESGGLEFIHAGRDNRERAEFIFVNEYGVLEHESLGDINGRGNYTWLQPKRPYNFRLAAGEYIGLFGLGEGRHWTLLANYMDDLRVRNIIALNLARELGISHTSLIRPVDVFINGGYAGVFDLVERRSLRHAVNLTDLQAATAKVNEFSLSAFPHGGVHEPLAGSIKYMEIPFNPDDITGGYLLEIQFPRRYMLAPSGFVSARGAAVNLRAPEYASRAQVEYISGFFQRLEDAVYSADGVNAGGEHFGELLDIRSFAMIYIFSEFLMDVDVGNSSFFMYKEADGTGSGRLYAGPPWDFDFTLGALGYTLGADFRDPRLWWANSGYIDNNPANGPHIVAALYSHEVFREYVTRLWREEAAGVLRVLIGIDAGAGGLLSIDCYIAEVYASRYMERLIWPLPDGQRYSYQCPDLTGFARARFEFLDSYWGEGQP